MNFKILTEKFDTDEKCLAYLENLRWGMTKKCPQCDSDKVRYYAVEKDTSVITALKSSA